MMKKISDALTPILMVILLGVVIYDRIDRNHGTTPVAVTHDESVVKLGKDYKAAIAKVAGDPFAKVANGKFVTISELTEAQRTAVDTALSTAYAPIATELEKRFGKAEDDTNKTSVGTIQSFFTDLSYGYGSK